MWIFYSKRQYILYVLRIGKDRAVSRAGSARLWAAGAVTSRVEHDAAGSQPHRAAEGHSAPHECCRHPWLCSSPIMRAHEYGPASWRRFITRDWYIEVELILSWWFRSVGVWEQLWASQHTIKWLITETREGARRAAPDYTMWRMRVTFLIIRFYYCWYLYWYTNYK